MYSQQAIPRTQYRTYWPGPGPPVPGSRDPPGTRPTGEGEGDGDGEGEGEGDIDVINTMTCYILPIDYLLIAY